jgi:Xaa-Pro aminopeptidase
MAKEKFNISGFDAVLISSVANITYLTGFSNFSIEEREAYLILVGDKKYIITDPRYSEAVKKQVKDFELLVISQQVPISEHLKSLAKKHKIFTLGIEEHDLRVGEAMIFKKHFKRLKPYNLNETRSVKKVEEIKKIKKASQIGDKTYEYILKQLKVGVTEKEIAHKLEWFFKSQGAEKSFDPIVAFGKNSSVPHHQTGNTKLGEKKGQLILLDFGVKYKNYCSDMTRTIFWGEPDKKKVEIYNAVKEAQENCLNYINKQIKVENGILKGIDVHNIASDFLESKGYPRLPHGLGHGIGLNVHEKPGLSARSKDILSPGMVFSIEPGIYLEGFGGVRIEDLFLLTEKGLVNLTRSSKILTTL